MCFHDFLFFLVQFTRFAQNGLRYADLTNVVEWG